jgi:putative membrane protein
MRQTKSLLAAAALVVAIPSVAAAAPPAKFLSDAAQGDVGEARLGTLIAARGGSANVRHFGTMLARDHGAHHGKVLALAARMHVSVKPGPMPEARDENAKLRGLHGRAFDREVRRYMIDDHHKDIAEYREQANGREPRTAALARATLPTLRRHLAAAEAL